MNGGFCGWFGATAASSDPGAALHAMRDGWAGHPADPAGARITPEFALGVAGATETDFQADDGPWVAVWGRPRFTDPEFDSIRRDLGVATAVARAYREHGENLPRHLHGGFAIAVVDPEQRTGLLAIDRVGGRFPLAFRPVRHGVVFSTRARALRAHPDGAGPVDPQALFDYIHFHVVPGPGTAWSEVRRLLPGQCAVWRDDGLEISTYWQPAYRDGGRARLADLEHEFHRVLRDSVAESAADGPVGCFLSGGTDSSTVAGILGEVTGEPARSYSIGFQAEGYDEVGFARTAAERFSTRHREYYLTPEDILAFIPVVAGSFSAPFGNASAVAALACARMAREDGVRRMLGGDGGDELFAGNTRYAKQRVFEAYGLVPRALRRGLVDPLVLGFPGGDSVPVLRKVRSYIRQAQVPMPDRAQAYSLTERFGVDAIFDPGFLEGVEPSHPLELLRDSYHSADSRNLVNRMLASDLRFTLADNDLPKVSRMCEVENVTAEYPLLSDAMIEFSCRVPVRYKVRGLKLRWFWKHALRDYLPQEILEKKKHGMGVPFGTWMREHAGLREVATDSLSGLRRRKILRDTFIDELETRHRNEHAEYYGALIWVLVQLEQWLRIHSDRPVAESIPARPGESR